MTDSSSTVQIVIRNARVLTLTNGGVPRRGSEMNDLGVRENCDVAVSDGRISGIGESLPVGGEKEFDASGRVLMPGLIDCHTHSCWAGVRYDELDRLGRGESYLDILASGGGIMSTVRAVRDADEADLAELTAERLGRMISLGATTIECKSGYGLSTDAELKMLRAIRRASQLVSAEIVPTALLGHAIDKEDERFIEKTIEESVPAVAEEFPGICLDAYCEQGAWTVEQCFDLFRRGKDLGLPFRVHADQFNSLGMIEAAVEMGAWSVDHLEASTDSGLKHLAESSTLGVMLPSSAFHLGDTYAPGRKFIDLGGALAIATNYNPGTGPSPSMPFALALAVKFLKLTPAEAICAGTINAAAVLHIDHLTGSIEAGKNADLILLNTTDERALVYEFAGNITAWVMVKGEIIKTPITYATWK